MENKEKPQRTEAAKTESRKDSHLALAFRSQNEQIDPRFYYEAMLAGHPKKNAKWPVKIGQQEMQYPLWISSMTGGTQKTNEINFRLAEAAAKYGLGLGVGSARIALEGGEKLQGFNLRPILGDTVPFYLNFGIAQIEKMLADGSIVEIQSLKEQLSADGVIIHVNPLQEWMQPEGDFIQNPPIDTIERFMHEIKIPVIVKEVGQGFGMESLKRLLMLPLVAVDFAANGGTNFSKLELLRNKTKKEFLLPFVGVGHSAEEMVEMSNILKEKYGKDLQCDTIIASGGIKSFLDGYYLLEKSKLNAIYGQASGLLKYAQESQQALNTYIEYQIEGLLLAKTYLKIKEK